MKKIKVNVDKDYEVLIEKGILDNCGDYIKQISNANKVCVVSDSNVFSLYNEKVISSLRENGFNVITYVFEAGEESKTIDTVMSIIDLLAQNEFTRKDLVVALGGGSCRDMAGFAAAIYLRGIEYVQLPTSLLAQVDSSVGGKTAVNLVQGKNLCGAFHQPKLVLIDPNTLDTLDSRVYAEGMAEALKMGCILDEDLFKKIEIQNNNEFIEDIIFESVKLKAIIVEHDEKEKGERALLNFGHTIGHAIEKLHNFKDIYHGEAVGIGMVLISQMGEFNNITQEGTSERIKKVLEKYNLPIKTSYSLSDIIKEMKSDKKRTQDSINLILLDRIGKGFIKSIRYDEIPGFFGIN